MHGLGIIYSANETYYALDELNSTHSNFVLYNRNWTYLTYKTVPIYYPISIISIYNESFITGNDGIYKTDKFLTIVQSYIRTGAVYRCIYHNYTTDILYVASQNSHRIDLFYPNLTFISSISLTGSPWALTEKNGRIYVGLIGGVISVIENNSIVKSIITLCTGYFTSILIDANDLMGVLCLSNSMLYLYTTNGSYTGKNMTKLKYPVFMNYDLNGHFIIAGENQITLYY